MRNFLLRFTQSVNQPRTALGLSTPFCKFGHMFLDRIHRIYMIDQLHPVNLVNPVKKRFLLLGACYEGWFGVEHAGASPRPPIRASAVRPNAQTVKMTPFGVRPVHSAHGHGKWKKAKFNKK